MDQISKDRQNFLLSELRDLTLYNYPGNIPADSPDIRAARKMIAVFNKKCERVRKSRHKIIERITSKIRHQIYFGDQRKAAAMIEKAKLRLAPRKYRG